jgi:uncharacterized membrane-anchored protein
MGRITPNDADRLRFFLEARRLDQADSLTLRFVADAAIQAGEMAIAEDSGRELLSIAAATRAKYGKRLDEPRQRVAGQCSIDREHFALTEAIWENSDCTHVGHTTLGIVALRSGDRVAARQHLRESGNVATTPRLGSYGPSTRLADELCKAGDLDEVTAYLKACKAIWTHDDGLLDEWLGEFAAGKIPEDLYGSGS